LPRKVAQENAENRASIINIRTVNAKEEMFAYVKVTISLSFLYPGQLFGQLAKTIYFMRVFFESCPSPTYLYIYKSVGQLRIQVARKSRETVTDYICKAQIQELAFFLAHEKRARFKYPHHQISKR